VLEIRLCVVDCYCYCFEFALIVIISLILYYSLKVHKSL